MNNVNQNSYFLDKLDSNLNCISVPILCWDFHYESVNEIKKLSSDIRKIKGISKKFKWNETDLEIVERLKTEVVLITDLKQQIIFASEGIAKMTGYTQNEVLGKIPKIFQGPETSVSVMKEIRIAIDKQIPFEKTILNYTKSGESYKCTIHGFPVFNVKGNLSHFIAFEKEAA